MVIAVFLSFVSGKTKVIFSCVNILVKKFAQKFEQLPVGTAQFANTFNKIQSFKNNVSKSRTYVVLTYVARYLMTCYILNHPIHVARKGGLSTWAPGLIGFINFF